MGDCLAGQHRPERHGAGYNRHRVGSRKVRDIGRIWPSRWLGGSRRRSPSLRQFAGGEAFCVHLTCGGGERVSAIADPKHRIRRHSDCDGHGAQRGPTRHGRCAQRVCAANPGGDCPRWLLRAGAGWKTILPLRDSNDRQAATQRSGGRRVPLGDAMRNVCVWWKSRSGTTLTAK
jgi:hypothetical protein